MTVENGDKNSATFCRRSPLRWPAYRHMSENNIDNYMRRVTPQVGDLTYSLLEAHLLFEELLNSYSMRVMAHPSALKGARLTFAQTLAAAKASSRHVEPDHWVWRAISDLNRIQNSLSHEAQPKDLPTKMSEHVAFVVANTNRPLPESAIRGDAGDVENSAESHCFTPADMATISFYYTTASLLGFSVSEVEQASGAPNAG